MGFHPRRRADLGVEDLLPGQRPRRSGDPAIIDGHVLRPDRTIEVIPGPVAGEEHSGHGNDSKEAQHRGRIVEVRPRDPENSAEQKDGQSQTQDPDEPPTDQADPCRHRFRTLPLLGPIVRLGAHPNRPPDSWR
ncbi:hypothetical protein ACFFX0_18125 [Citricoccus parietis]|uniref:Uncharacterized protein n=1 Tax=Citricoccus parietis TaxID=592307 RepID=A0ABV5G282_9MICC